MTTRYCACEDNDSDSDDELDRDELDRDELDATERLCCGCREARAEIQAQLDGLEPEAITDRIDALFEVWKEYGELLASVLVLDGHVDTFPVLEARGYGVGSIVAANRGQWDRIDYDTVLWVIDHCPAVLTSGDARKMIKQFVTTRSDTGHAALMALARTYGVTRELLGEIHVSAVARVETAMKYGYRRVRRDVLQQIEARLLELSKYVAIAGPKSAAGAN